MNVNDFLSALSAEFFTGVPDSKLRPLVDHLMDTYGVHSPAHVIAVNEGSAAALAAPAAVIDRGAIMSCSQIDGAVRMR